MSISHLKIAIFIVVSILSLTRIFSQEIHFSQTQKTPVYQNSAETGIFDGDFRFSNIYRNQWHKIDYPYSTLQLSVDSKLRLFNRFTGVGALILHDESSSNKLTVDKIYLSFSHSFFYRNHQLSIGLQPGIVLKKYGSDRITFGNQFNSSSETFDPSLPSNEDNLNDKANYFDVNTGFYWRTKIKNIIPSSGITFKHINLPNESFMSGGNKKTIPINYSVYGSLNIPLFTNFKTEPLLYYNVSSSARELIVGTTTFYEPENWGVSIDQVYLLSAFRSNPASNFDAVIIGAGTKILNFDIGFSYDLNVSDLNKASNFQGAYEISIIYITNRKGRSNKPEPCYLL